MLQPIAGLMYTFSFPETTNKHTLGTEKMFLMQSKLPEQCE